MLKFSIIIPTHNRLEALKACLESVESLDDKNFEVIVVDDASSDGTKEYLDNLKNPKYRVIHNAENQGQATSRNNGVKIAKAEIIAFTDDDCQADKQWLQELEKGFNDPAVGFVFGATYYVSQDYRGRFPERVVKNQQGKWPGSGNIAYRKSTFEKLGGFDAMFVKYHNEDSELAIRAVAKGIKFSRAPEAKVFHQKQLWTVPSLLASSRNASVWPVLKRIYPQHYRTFHPPISAGVIVNPMEYLYIIFFPIFFVIILVRYLMNGHRDLIVFLAKWPVWLILKRLFIYISALENRVLML